MTDHTVSLAWDASTDNVQLVGYYLFRSDFSLTEPIATLNPSQRTYTDSGLQSNKSYGYYVQAYDEVGNKSSPVYVPAKTKVACLFAGVCFPLN